MFDIGWSELLLIGVVALVAIGPKELPGAIYQLGRWVKQMRAMAREFQTHVDDLMHQAEVEELRKQAMKATDFDIETMAEKAVDPDRSLRTALAPEETGQAGHAGSPPEESPEPLPLSPLETKPEPVPVQAEPARNDKTA